MKKQFSLLLCLCFLALYACGEQSQPIKRAIEEVKETTSKQSLVAIQTSKHDPFSYAAKAYYDKYWEGGFGDDDDYGEARYAFYEIDKNGTKALFLAGGEADIYMLENGIAVQQPNIFSSPEGDWTTLLKTGIVWVSISGTEDCYYKFSSNKLVLLARWEHENFGDVGGKFFRIDENGNEISITEEEYKRMKKEYEGDGEAMPLDWKPLTEYGK